MNNKINSISLNEYALMANKILKKYFLSSLNFQALGKNNIEQYYVSTKMLFYNAYTLIE